MGFLFHKKKEAETIFIFDIGSGSVGGAIVRMPTQKGGVPTIVNTTRTNIDYHRNKLNSFNFTKKMLISLHTTANHLYHNSPKAPSKIITVLAAPWYSSETKIIKIVKEVSFVFNKKIADDLIKKELKKTESYHNKDKHHSYNKQEIIENHIMGVSLNGYKVSLPLGMRTKSVELNIITSISTKSFLDKIRKTISKTFHSTPVYFSSFMISMYLYVRSKYISPNSYLLLDIGSEITEVGIVLKGSLKSTLSFPFGKETFFKYISTKLDIEIRDAEELFRLYMNKALSKPKMKKLASLFESAEYSWSEAFRSSITKLPYILALPSSMFLTADNDIIDYFSDIITNDSYIKSMTIEHKCDVVSIKSYDFNHVCNTSKDTTCDPFLMIETVSEIIKNAN